MVLVLFYTVKKSQGEAKSVKGQTCFKYGKIIISKENGEKKKVNLNVSK